MKGSRKDFHFYITPATRSHRKSGLQGGLQTILFEDEELQEGRKRRDPILSAKPSESIKRKKATHQTADGLPVHSFETLMAELATRGRVTYRLKSKDLDLVYKEVPDLTPVQLRAHELLGLLPVAEK